MAELPPKPPLKSPANPVPVAKPAPVASPTSSAARAGTSLAQRLLSIDAYRGAVMLLLVFLDGPSDGWWEPIERAYPGHQWLSDFLHQFSHVDWVGIRIWDMIQPSFMFLVGTSLAFSCAARARRGQTFGRMLAHAIYRSVVLILFGVFLRSLGRPMTRWTFEDVVTQIGLGYTFLFLLWNRGWKIQLAAAAAILVGYWMLFALWPLPGSSYDWAAVQGHEYFMGFLAHWNKNANPSHYFDVWFLNLFPRSEPFVANDGGYGTLNFVPSLATMIFGLMAGELLRSEATTKQKLLWVFGGGVLLGGLGAALHFGGVCPIVKRIWTPSFALAAGGISLAVLALMYAVIDVVGWRRWAFPMIVAGENSIAAYGLVHIVAGPTLEALHRHLGQNAFAVFGPYELLAENLATGLILWLILWWMHRRRIFLRI